MRKRAERLNAGVMMELFVWWSLASDASRLAALGAAFWTMAGFAGFMEWRRGKGRSVERLEKVGWVPWLPLFIMCTMIGGGCLAIGLPVVVANL